jgi:hypothetical protein
MSLHEVSTAVEHNLPVVACVFRNMWWGAEAKNQVDFYNNRFIGVDIPTPESFVPVAKAMGANGIRVDKAQNIREAFDACIKSRKPRSWNSWWTASNWRHLSVRMRWPCPRAFYPNTPIWTIVTGGRPTEDKRQEE